MTPTLRTDVSSLLPEGAVPPKGCLSAERVATLLDVKDLRISFAGKEVVHGIDFHIAPGEKLALVGESGSGKTITALSLLKLVQDAAISGKAVFSSRDGNVDLLSLA